MKLGRFIQMIFIALLLLAMLTAGGCASKTSKSVERTDPNTTIDLSGRWNDTDSRGVSTEIITDCLSQGWLDNWKADNPTTPKPRVIVGTVINKSHEHINVETFIKDIQRALINSGKVRFVSSRSERRELRRERRDQQSGLTSDETKSAIGEEKGANFMLKGSIKTILDEEGGKKVIFYQTDLELHNIETNDIVWIGQKKIKKVIKRSSTRI